MKILVVGDQHFRYQLPYANAVEDGRRSEWDAVIAKIHDTAKECDAVVLLGDNLNSRHNHSSVNREFVEFIKGFGDKYVYIIAGNHERFGKETAIDFLKQFEVESRLVVMTEPTHATINAAGQEVKASFLPYMTPGSLDCEDVPEAGKKVMDFLTGGDVLFHHHIVTGTTIGGAAPGDLHEIVMPREPLEERYKWILGGHIHVPQKVSEKSHVLGNIFTQETGEHEKFVWILDTDEQKLNPVPLPVRSIYKLIIDSNTLPDLVHMKGKSAEAIVKFIVTDRSVDVEALRKEVAHYDSAIIIEQYPSERAKVALSDAGGLDLSINNLLQVYSDVRDVLYEDLKSGMDILEHHESTRT